MATTSSHFTLNQFVESNDITSGYHDDTDSNFLLDEQSGPKNLPEVTYNEFVEKSEVKVDFMPIKIGESPKLANPQLSTMLKMGDEATLLNMLAKNTFKHSTPTEMIRWNILTEDMLKNYSIYGFIRDPIQRALSAFFFEKFFYKVETSYKDVEHWIDNMFDVGPTVFMGKKYKNYFYYNNKQIAEPLDYKHYTDIIKSIVNTHNGILPESMPTFKAGCRPVWSREHVKTWLSAKHLSRLEAILSDDIDFYNKAFKE